MVALFSNIASLYKFHNDHLLPQLVIFAYSYLTWASFSWTAEETGKQPGSKFDTCYLNYSNLRISDVMRKQAPFLKLYSEYTNNYKNAVQTYEECARKKRIYEIIQKLEVSSTNTLTSCLFQKLPECENLSLISHLVGFKIVC